MGDDKGNDEYEELGQTNLPEPQNAYDGRSDRKDLSDVRDFHLAVQRAAKAAAADLAPGEEALFDLSHVRVVIGNPNVKVYSVTLTKTPTG